MCTTPRILETGSTKRNLRSGRDGVTETLGLRLVNGRTHGCSRTIEGGGPIVKTPEAHDEGIVQG